MTFWSPNGSFRALLEQKRSPSWLSEPNSKGYFGVLFGMIPDEATEAFTITCRMHLLADNESPDDILPLIEKDRGLPRYYLESPAQHRQRLLDAWTIYEYAGTEHVIETQLSAAGFPGSFVEFRPSVPGPRHGDAFPYRTQFWIVMPSGSHPVTGPCRPWGTFIWGETWIDVSGVWAPTGLTVDFYRTVMGIIRKWKPSDHIFRGFTFVLADGSRIELPVGLGASTL